jgi:protein-tyrosine phosphatase
LFIDEEEDHVEVEEEDAHVSGEWNPDLHWVTEHLAVGSCFPIERADDLRRLHRIQAVVDLREEDCDDEALLRAAGIELLHLPTPDLEAASHDDLERGVAFVRERIRRGDKVLIHCQHGIGRSALLALCVLVDHGWEPLDALTHVKDRRAVVSPSHSQFQGWVRWLNARGIEAPDYHSFGCIAYRHLAGR